MKTQTLMLLFVLLVPLGTLNAQHSLQKATTESRDPRRSGMPC